MKQRKCDVCCLNIDVGTRRRRTCLGEFLEFALGELEALALHVVVRRVRQQLVNRDDVPRDLEKPASAQRFLASRFPRLQFHICAHVSPADVEVLMEE